MRKLTHLLLSPPSRFARLVIGEKRLSCDWVTPEDLFGHLPVFVDLDGTRCEGLWAIIDHLEGTYQDQPLTPEEARDTAALLRPDLDPTEVAARAAWSVLVEPGDGVAGALIQSLGATEALRTVFGDLSLTMPGLVPPRAMSEAVARWRPRAQPRAVRDALLSAHSVGARLLLPGDELWPEGLHDLDAHQPVLLWARGMCDALHAESAVAINPASCNW